MLVDTHAVFEDLVESGFEDQKAKAIVKTLSSLDKQIATKAEIKALETKLETKIDASQREMMARFDSFEQRMKKEMWSHSWVTAIAIIGVLKILQLAT